MDPETAAKKLAQEAARIAGLHVVDTKPLAGEPIIECMADVATQDISWLWPGKIPLGKLSILAGDPGLGKSVLALDLAARVSTGRDWPDGSPCQKGSIIILSAEDDVGDTIKPRLMAAGANLGAIDILRAVRRASPNGQTSLRAFNLQTDIPALREAAARRDDMRLVLVDPISAYLGAVDSHKNAEVRAVLSPLSELASDLQASVLAINHLNKGSGPAVYRLIGSIGFAASARAVWVVARSKDNATERLLLPAKMNLAPDVEGFSFSLVEVRRGTVGITWGYAVNVTADTVLGPESPDERSERVEASQWLRDRLSAGPVAVKKLQDEAKAAGLSWMTVRRAKDALGVDSIKESLAGGWAWALRPEGAQHPTPPTPEHLHTSEAAHIPEGAHQDAHQSQSEHLQKNPNKQHEEALSLSKMLTGVGETGFVRDSEGPGVTCEPCGNHFGTLAGWRAHRLRGRCEGKGAA